VRPNTAGASTLAALAVPEDRIEAVAALVGAEPGVNHSYLREADWNLWFVATAPNAAALAAMLARIRSTSGLSVLDLRLVRPFNIDLGFPLAGGPVSMPVSRTVQATILRDDDRPLLDALSRGLDLTPRPFAALAERLGQDEAAIISRIADLIAAGILTRLGVIVRHRALGFTANAMVVWDVAEADTEAAGLSLAALPGVTLAYERRPVAGVWPYRLYCMIHARSRPEAMDVLATARALPALAGVDHRILFSTRCFKQSGARLQEAA
jgi:DNA-binding Lrp family transcriptional regulator